MEVFSARRGYHDVGRQEGVNQTMLMVWPKV